MAIREDNPEFYEIIDTVDENLDRFREVEDVMDTIIGEERTLNLYGKAEATYQKLSDEYGYGHENYTLEGMLAQLEAVTNPEVEWESGDYEVRDNWSIPSTSPEHSLREDAVQGVFIQDGTLDGAKGIQDYDTINPEFDGHSPEFRP